MIVLLLPPQEQGSSIINAIPTRPWKFNTVWRLTEVPHLRKRISFIHVLLNFLVLTAQNEL